MAYYDLVSLIKAISYEAVRQRFPCELLYGTWRGDCLRIDDSPPDIPLEMIDVADSLLEHAVVAEVIADEGGTSSRRVELGIDSSLKKGDKVLVMKHGGGKRFSIIGKYRMLA